MTDEKPLKTREEIIKDLLSPFQSALNAGGINEQFLIKQLKQEFKSKEPKVIKVKGAVKKEDLPRGYKVITTTGLIEFDKEGNREFSDGETIIEYQVHNIGISQKARIDAHKLRGDYPAEKHELSGHVQVTPELTPEDRELLRSTTTKVVNDILQQHRESIKSGR